MCTLCAFNEDGGVKKAWGKPSTWDAIGRYERHREEDHFGMPIRIVLCHKMPFVFSVFAEF